ncbi:MAG: DNA polymerase III subunit beta [Clostridia bacterium]|nr:DNA polymerase III subunit beta [Clostridia bacterium]
MICNLDRATLLDAVSRLQRVVANRSTEPVLEGILISAKDHTAVLTAYNLEMGMRKEMDCRCEEAGEVVINAKLLGDILRKLNGPSVEINSYKNNENVVCQIKSGEAVFNINVMSASDFPELPMVLAGNKIVLDSHTFSDMVRGTIFSVEQKENARPILMGIDISVKDNVLQFVAIDGYRLAIRREKIENTDDIEFVVSGKAIGEAVKLIGEETENIELLVSERMIMFNIDGYTFISRLLEGDFVDYKNAIPSKYQQTMVVNTRDMINVIERVSLLISDFLTFPIRCYFDNEEVTFSCATSVGTVTEKFMVAMNGEPFEIGWNSRLMLEALKAIDDSFVKIKFNGSNAGVVICPIEDERDEYLYTVMPMRLKNVG